jgi:5-dehydro-2-deoxygluconokinase
LIRGFAVGRTIFSDAARQYLAAKIDDETAITMMAEKFAALTRAWTDNAADENTSAK